MKKIIGSLILVGQLLIGAEVYATFNVEAKQSSKLSLDVAGLVSMLNVDIGDKVSQGQVLLELDKQQQALDVKLAQNALRLSNLSYKYANNSYKRYIEIKNVIDKEQFEKVELDKKLKHESIAQSTNSLKRSKVALSKRTLKAPYTGMITAKHIEVGDGVSGTAHVLLEMMAYPNVKLVLNFDQKYWNSIKVGQTFKYKIDGETQEREGKISKIYPIVDSKNRKLQAEVITKDIMPGLFGDGTIVTE
ncbi:MAG: efflux RND transporter periplasmic adaptor subunit [Epsilonproteobacteria bacterium]|nr:efflux RND transporter periplasmic adaptor subunit [Campylobacterota bacterium]